MIIKFLRLHRRKNHEKTGPGWEKTLTDAGEQADEIHTVQGDSGDRPQITKIIFDESNRIEQTKLLFDSTRIRIYILNSIRLDLASNRIRFDVRKFDRSSTYNIWLSI